MVQVTDMPEIVWRGPESVFGRSPHWTIDQGRGCWTPGESTSQTSLVLVDGGDVAHEVGVVDVFEASDDVVDAWRRYYLAGHSWDPPREQSLSFWRQTLGAAEDVVLTWPSEPPFRGLAIVGPVGSGRVEPSSVMTRRR